MSTKLFQSVLLIVLCLAFGISEAHVIVVDNNNASQNVDVKSHIDMTNYEKRTLANGKEIYTLKQNTSSKIMNAEEAELVNVTFLCSYDGTSMMPGELITVNGDNFSGDLWMEQDWMTGIYSLTTQLPAGTYDFCSYGYYISDKGLLYNVKELVQINNDTTITFDFSESNIKYNFKTIKPNGEEATLDACVFDEDLLLYTVVTPGNTISFTDNIFLILKGSDYLGGYVGSSYGPSSNFEVLGENPSATIYLNNVSNRYKLVSMRMLEDENDIYIVKYESTDMSETLIQNNPENFVLYANYRKTKRTNRLLYEKNIALLNANKELRPAVAENLDKPAQEEPTPADLELMEKITALMESSPEVFAETFSLNRLAELVGSNSKYVSRAINSCKKCNFSVLLNEYRIKEACRRLMDTVNYGNYTIEGIANSVGYKSRSNFTTIFKESVGLTPSAFQKLSQNGENPVG